MTWRKETPADPKDIDSYYEVTDYQTVISPSASSFRSILEDVANKFEDDYDIDQATADYIDAIAQAIKPYGYTLTASGIATFYPYKGYDREGATEAAKDIDVFEMLEKNSK